MADGRPSVGMAARGSTVAMPAHSEPSTTISRPRASRAANHHLEHAIRHNKGRNHRAAVPTVTRARRQSAAQRVAHAQVNVTPTKDASARNRRNGARASRQDRSVSPNSCSIRTVVGSELERRGKALSARRVLVARSLHEDLSSGKKTATGSQQTTGNVAICRSH